MKNTLIGALGLCFLFGITVVSDAYARGTVECEFRWASNEAANVAAGRSLPITRRFRNKEYNRLVSMGSVNARVAADHGGRCQLNHPENTTIDITILKEKHRLDKSGRIPNCSDFNATVRCIGK